MLISFLTSSFHAFLSFLFHLILFLYFFLSYYSYRPFSFLSVLFSYFYFLLSILPFSSNIPSSFILFVYLQPSYPFFVSVSIFYFHSLLYPLPSSLPFPPNTFFQYFFVSPSFRVYTSFIPFSATSPIQHTTPRLTRLLNNHYQGATELQYTFPLRQRYLLTATLTSLSCWRVSAHHDSCKCRKP